jgi:hypothetical protein
MVTHGFLSRAGLTLRVTFAKIKIKVIEVKHILALL